MSVSSETPKLPYSKQTIDADDVKAVLTALQSPWLTTGPMVERFETAVARYVEANHAVAVSSGTAALHTAVSALHLKPGDEIIVPAISFVATANSVVYCGGEPVFADVDPQTLLIDAQDVIRKISARTRAIIAVDYAGQTCDYPLLRQIARANKLRLIADACHSLGAKSFSRHVAQWADMSCYSFHPVKPMTTCEGGMVVTNDEAFAGQMRRFRNHGISSDHAARTAESTWYYDMDQLGYNYRLSDVQCALGISQLRKLDDWALRRQAVADDYHELIRAVKPATPLTRSNGAGHANHLYVVRWSEQQSGVARDDVFRSLRAMGVGVNVHYRPIYQHSFYRGRQGTRFISCPNAEQAFAEVLSLPLFPSMTHADVHWVVNCLSQVRELTPPGHQSARDSMDESAPAGLLGAHRNVRPRAA